MKHIWAAVFIIYFVSIVLCSKPGSTKPIRRLEQTEAGSIFPNLFYQYNQLDGSFYITFNNQTFLTSASYGFYSSGQWYFNSNKLLVAKETVSGTDELGYYDAVRFYWTANRNSFVTSFKTYNQYNNVIVFEQYFPSGINTTGTGDNTDVITAFPVFSTRTPSPLNYLTYFDKFATPQIGRFSEPNITAGSIGGVPLALWDSNLNTIVISPLSNLMTGTQVISASLGKSLACGIQGMVEQIPAQLLQQYIMVAGVGLNQTMFRWGELLQRRFAHVPVSPLQDITSAKLSYWTDNGAYYYYNTEAKHNNYSQTMIDVRQYIRSLALEIGSFQFDSWWYYKGINNALSLWEPRPYIFQNGMLPVDQAMGAIPLTLHNRYFGSDNQYIDKGFPFIVEPPWALPTSEGLFTYIMAKAKKWGLAVYEQDWINEQYLNMKGTQNNVAVGRQWLLDMGNAAKKLNLKIQYCMPLPNSILQSVEVGPVVIQIRATDDYQPGNLNWQIATSSMLIWSLGKIPFKDVFLTAANSPGCPYPYCNEPNGEFEALVATLSTGPVGFGDSIGFANKTILSKTCRQDGILLKPNKPSTPIDRTFNQFNTMPQIIQLWDTYSQHYVKFATADDQLLRWHSIVAADMPTDFTLYPNDIGLNNNVFYLVFNYADPQGTIRMFSAKSPITIPAAPTPPAPAPAKPTATVSTEQIPISSPQPGRVNISQQEPHLVHYNYYIAFPWEQMDQRGSGSGWALLASLFGSAGEIVNISFILDESLTIRTVSCTLGREGTTLLTCAPRVGCRC